MWGLYGLKLKIWELERSLQGQTHVSMSLTCGKDFEAFTVRYDLDMRPLEEGEYPKLTLTHEVEENGEKKLVSYQIHTTQTRCNLGGERLWFRCPMKLGQCKRRVGVLYFNGHYFGCGKCVGYEHASRGINYSSRSAVFMAALEASDYEEKHLKRYTWRGQETRKMQRFRKLCERAGMPRYPDWLISQNGRSRYLRTT